MKTLIFDTSTNDMFILLNIEGKQVDCTLRSGKQDHGAHLIDQIDHILKKHQLTLKDIDQIIVGVGPGSYTGIRVSVMTAKMLGLATTINVKKISSLALLTSGYEETVFAWHDARNDQGFSATYHKGRIQDEESVRHLNDLTNKQLKQKIDIHKDTIRIDTNVVIHTAQSIDDINSLVPNYLRKTMAEMKLNG